MMSVRRRPSPSPLSGAATCVAFAATAVLGACSTQHTPTSVRALDPETPAPAVSEPLTQGPGDAQATSGDPAGPPGAGKEGDPAIDSVVRSDAGADEPSADDDPAEQDATARRTVDTTLAEYDRALTDLAALPESLHDLGSPQRRAWDSVVDPLGTLHADLIERIDRRYQIGRQRVVPGPTGLSFEHRGIDATRHGDSVEFRWCGFSPGVAVDIDSSAVRDDALALSHGVGTLTRSGESWLLSALVESDLTTLDDGTANPCESDS